MALSHKNGIALSGLSHVNGIALAGLTAINGLVIGGGGGGGVAFVDAIDPTRGSSVATLSASGTAGLTPSGSNRAAFGAIHTLDFSSQATHDDMDLGSSSFTQVGSTVNTFSGFNSLSLWQLIAPNTGQQTASGDWSASQFAAVIGMVCYSGVHQTTPLGTVATDSNFFTTTTGTVSVTVPSTTSGRTVIAFAFVKDANAGPVSPEATTGTTVRYSAGGTTGDSISVLIYERIATGSSTVMNLDISVPVADGVEWYVMAAEIIPA